MKFVIFVILLINLADAYAENRCASQSFQEENYCVIAGGTADTTKTVNSAHARSMALKTARILAYEKMAEKIEGITLKSFTNLNNDLYDDNQIKTIVESTLKDISFENERLSFLSDGSPWAEVTISVPKQKHIAMQEEVLNFSNGMQNTSETLEQAIVIDLRDYNESLNMRFDLKTGDKTIYSYNPLKSDLVFISNKEELPTKYESIKPSSLNASEVTFGQNDGLKINNQLFKDQKIYILR